MKDHTLVLLHPDERVVMVAELEVLEAIHAAHEVVTNTSIRAFVYPVPPEKVRL